MAQTATDRKTTFHYDDGKKIVLTYEFIGFTDGPELLDRYMAEMNSALMAFFTGDDSA